jgi:hypothetical protein
VCEWSEILHSRYWSRPTSNRIFTSENYFQWSPFNKYSNGTMMSMSFERLIYKAFLTLIEWVDSKMKRVETRGTVRVASHSRTMINGRNVWKDHVLSVQSVSQCHMSSSNYQTKTFHARQPIFVPINVC